MPRLQLPNDVLWLHTNPTGDGFPLILLPGPERPRRLAIPPAPSRRALPRRRLRMLPAATGRRPPAGLSRRALRIWNGSTLPAPAPGWAPALEFARRHPNALEALLLVDFPGSEAEVTPLHPAFTAHLPGLALPTLILLAGDASPARPTADCLSNSLPHCRTVIMGRPGPHQPALPTSPQRQFPHHMMQFLLDRERHRNLVRGASFLL